ncbi:MAG: NAD-dependent DNA ligase LigA, partial [Elusimicrobiota bacterium]|nr:NAD-dependent DNA ligase LigA [Elusimicrobiota bacterium]
MKEIKARIEFLKAEIVRHNELYYLKDDPEISDIEYDALVKELEKLEKENPHLFRQDSPSSKVSGGRSSTFAPISHLAPMLSLDNTYSESEIEKWYERILKTLASGKAECIVEPKVDGASVNLRYENSILTSAATRGDGGTGEDITENIKTVSDIPQTLSNAAASGLSIEIRGEIYIGKQDFEELNERVLRESGQKFANARNAAAGSLRQKNPQITAGRRLKFFAHSLGASDFDFKTQFDFLKFCQQCGFRLQKDIKICRTLKEIIDFSAEMLVKRDELQYEIDGLVIKTNLIESQKELGNTNKSPRWAVSYKFPAKQVSTKILKIRVQVGRTGAQIGRAH